VGFDWINLVPDRSQINPLHTSLTFGALEIYEMSGLDQKLSGCYRRSADWVLLILVP